MPRRFRELQSSSDLAYDRLYRWITDCNEHQDCRAPSINSKLPTRVLDVLASEVSIALHESGDQVGVYVALSHSWGKSQRLILTKANLEDLKRGIAVSSLPRTFQDAIKITRRLNIQYL